MWVRCVGRLLLNLSLSSISVVSHFGYPLFSCCSIFVRLYPSYHDSFHSFLPTFLPPLVWLVSFCAFLQRSFKYSEAKVLLLSTLQRLLMTPPTGHEKLPSTTSLTMKEDIAPEAAPWKPLKQEYLVMLTISVLSLMVALDATILVPVLPVSFLHHSSQLILN